MIVRDDISVKFPTLCPWCGYRHSHQARFNDPGEPQTGDLTLCISCGEFAIFAPVPGGLRKPTDDEFLEFGTDREVQRVRQAWVAMNEARKRGEL